MALTVRQKITLYSILGVPYGTRIERIMDRDNMLAQTYNLAGSEQFWATTKIEQRLTEIALIPELEADLVYSLDRWYDMFGDTTEIQGGSSGGTTGLSYSLQQERAQIRERVIAIVPFTKEYMESEMGRATREHFNVSSIR